MILSVLPTAPHVLDAFDAWVAHHGTRLIVWSWAITHLGAWLILRVQRRRGEGWPARALRGFVLSKGLLWLIVLLMPAGQTTGWWPFATTLALLDTALYGVLFLAACLWRYAIGGVRHARGGAPAPPPVEGALLPPEAEAAPEPDDRVVYDGPERRQSPGRRAEDRR